MFADLYETIRMAEAHGITYAQAEADLLEAEAETNEGEE